MQEWMIAMLAIIGLLILRDMAKTILSNRRSKEMCIRDRKVHSVLWIAVKQGGTAEVFRSLWDWRAFFIA